MKNSEIRNLRANDDGRVVSMMKTPNGKYHAIFNSIKTKYVSISITKEQFEKYLPYCSDVVEGDEDEKGYTFYFEPKPDNGLPGWVNWLFF